MKMLRSFIFLLAFAVPVFAGPDPHDAQIEAAANDAVGRLRADIESQPLGQDLSVADFLKQTGSCDDLVQALRRADQIGGPRWIDDQTCQVKLAISSDRVRQALVKIAADNGRRSPLPPDAIQAKLRVWDDRTFTATGTSISASRAQMIRPIDAIGAWRRIPDDARKQTIAAARENAVDRILESVGAIELSDGKTVSAVLSDNAIRDPLRAALLARPVTRLEFKNDLSVEITLSADGCDVYEAFVDAASKSDLLPRDSLMLAKIRRAFVQQALPAVGSARASGQPNNTTAAARIPRQPPAWVSQSLTSQATEKFKDSRLKTARAAEYSARDALRVKIDALDLSQSTVGEAAKRDPAVERAIQQAMDRSRAYKIEYLPDGSATVKVSLDPRDLWDQLRELP